eukprot:scaffold186_cov189-Skeletonema_marinoi.AAC.4
MMTVPPVLSFQIDQLPVMCRVCSGQVNYFCRVATHFYPIGMMRRALLPASTLVVSLSLDGLVMA